MNISRVGIGGTLSLELKESPGIGRISSSGTGEFSSPELGCSTVKDRAWLPVSRGRVVSKCYEIRV